RWPAPSRQPASPPAARRRASSWPPRPLASPRRARAASRSRIATGLARWPCARSGATRRAPSCSSASCHSSGWCARSPRTSRPTCAFSRPPLVPCRRPARPTWSACSRTRTCAPSTPSGSPSCPRTSSWPAGSAASAPERCLALLRNSYWLQTLL
ncbi:hypothetical protein BOX15_Mlig013013g1, partial [Macrostomum lignano]